jgi:hypothetical protein
MPGRALAFMLAICTLALAGSCVSPEELRREDEARCAGYGFQIGTPDFANCLQRESLARLYLTPPPSPPYWAWGYWGRYWGLHCCRHRHSHRIARAGPRHKH